MSSKGKRGSLGHSVLFRSFAHPVATMRFQLQGLKGGELIM